MLSNSKENKKKRTLDLSDVLEPSIEESYIETSSMHAQEEKDFILNESDEDLSFHPEYVEDVFLNLMKDEVC